MERLLGQLRGSESVFFSSAAFEELGSCVCVFCEFHGEGVMLEDRLFSEGAQDDGHQSSPGSFPGGL